MEVVLTVDNVGTALTKAREDKNITRDKLGSMSKISRQTIHNIEEGGHDVGVKKLIKAVDSLDKELVLRDKEQV